MWSYAVQGWATARRSWFLLLLLFLYQYLMGFVLFKYVKSTVVPLLHRYPGGELNDAASRLFWLEAEFQLTKTDLIQPFLWTFAGFVLLRMIATPLLNGGIYHALAHPNEGGRKAFAKGVRTYARPFLLLYALQAVVTFAPLVWIAPRVLEAAASSFDWTAIAMAVAPYALGWLAYQGLVELVFMYVGFGIVGGTGGWSSLAVFARRALPAVALALATFAIVACVALAAAALSLWWAGFFALLLHQSYPLIRSLLKLWTISAQHHLWSSSATRL
ncbi:hypothetical protein MO973_42345 [Paenibacillus sp. TRM 82003]|nr:hypothetical protein [Paenibacillus sp. TRM 82003]